MNAASPQVEERMRLFITGATGFIGTHLVKRVAQSGHEMVCLVRTTSDVSTLKEVGATFVQGDVTDKESLVRGMRGCEAVINLANLYTFWAPNPQVYAEVNIRGTRNTAEAALETGVHRFLHLSSALVYGKPSDVPFTEESIVGPVRFSEYARTKYEGDQAVWGLTETRGLPLVMIYPGAVLGTGDLKPSGQYIQDLLWRRTPATALQDAILTWVHVQDVVGAIEKALAQENNLGEKYLIGKEQLSLQEFNTMVSEASGVPLPRMRLPDSVVTASAMVLTWLASLTQKPPIWGMSQDQIRTIEEGFRFDGSKAERELGITYTPVRVALEEAIAFYRAMEDEHPKNRWFVLERKGEHE